MRISRYCLCRNPGLLRLKGWIPENLLHYLESDAERKNMTLKEAVVQALRLYYTIREIRRQFPYEITLPVEEQTYMRYQRILKRIREGE